MGSKKLLYAGLLAISVGCGEDEERIAREKEYCENRLADVTRVLTLANSTPNIIFDQWSGELRQRLYSNDWCKVQGSYQQEGTDLSFLATQSALDYCSDLESEANNLVTRHESAAISLIFSTTPKCEGDTYTSLLNQAKNVQRVIDSYKK